MKIKLYIILAVLLIFWIVNSCSPFEETQKNQETEKEKIVDSVYIFDEVPPENLFKLESPVQQSSEVYVVQIGAFSNLERAKEFAEQSRAILNNDIKVEFAEKKNLYVVWIHPPFQDKISAENYRSELGKNDEFKDAWIVTIDSKK
jgi:cell division septation protein DedD